MFSVKVSSDDMKDRLDANFYRPEYLEIEHKLKQLGSATLGSLCNGVECGPFGGNAIADDLYAEQGVAFIRPVNISSHVFDESSLVKVPEQLLIDNKLKIYKGTNLYFGRVGDPCVAVIDRKTSISPNIIVAKTNPELADPHYLWAFGACTFGLKQLLRQLKTVAQPTTSTEAVRNLSVFNASLEAQKYIGDKVRQAEQLRAWAKRLEISVEHLLISNEEYLSGCNTAETRVSRPQLNDLSNRLDPKYYGNKAIAVHRFARKTGRVLGGLIKSVANGFEERSFIEEGLPYITVSEVSSGRLNAQAAPKISKSVDVPAKAIIHESCVLVVRTGSIGTAVKVHELDKGCAISSHLIRLEFDDEETAAAVAVFLNSAAGKVLLHKISYGAVQPQIGQEELLALSIPEYVLNEKAKCLELLNNSELAIRASVNLTTTAKTLVEALIEGHLTEQQLIQAQQALEDGDNSLDQAILSKLSNEGYAIDGATPLFSDLDELYRLLERAAQAETEE
jgi:type I restriction enzyme S subunit